jgi:magnesium-transporting ATPase (P-type)
MNIKQDKILQDINKSLWIIGIFSLLSSILFLVAYVKLHLFILLIAVIVIFCSLPIVIILALKMKHKYIVAKENAEKLN